MPAIDPTAIYSPDDLAELLQITERQARRYMEERKISFVQLERGRRVLGEDLLAYLEARKIERED